MGMAWSKGSSGMENMAEDIPSTTNYDFLMAIIEKCEKSPKLLILSWGNRPGGAEPPRRVQQWAETNQFAYKMHVTNPHDPDHQNTTEDHGAAIANFIAQYQDELNKVVIFHQGHGTKDTGAWQGGIQPEQVKDMEKAGNGNIKVVTGACFGGRWLKHFEGLSATNGEQPAPGDGHGGEFWPWLFAEGPFPSKRSPCQNGFL